MMGITLPPEPPWLVEERHEASRVTYGAYYRIEKERKEKLKTRRMAWGICGGIPFLTFGIPLTILGQGFAVGFALCVVSLIYQFDMRRVIRKSK